MQSEAALWEHLCGFLSENRIELFERVVQERTRHLRIVVEDVYQERNASAAVRTCDCMGIQQVDIIENYNTHRLSSEIAKGADKWLDIQVHDVHAGGTTTCLEQIKADGYQVVVTSPHRSSVGLDELNIARPTALVFGGEKDGISEAAVAAADGFLSIPMTGFTESYNLSVSVGIVMHHLVDRLKKSEVLWRLDERAQLELLVQWAQRSIKGGEQIAEEFLKAAT